MHGNFPRPGSVAWIGLTPKKMAKLVSVESAVAQVGSGLEGDRHCASGRGTGKRQVTLIQSEHLDVISALLGKSVTAFDTRRNIVVSGISLFAMRYARFRVGEVLLEGTGICAPCNRMEAELGPGAFNAMRGHGGITARVVEAGVVRLGDAVRYESGDPPKGEE